MPANCLTRDAAGGKFTPHVLRGRRLEGKTRIMFNPRSGWQRKKRLRFYPLIGGQRRLDVGFDEFGRKYFQRVDWHVGIPTSSRGRYRADFVYYLSPFDDSPENAIARSVLTGLLVQKEVVFGIDKELAGSAIRYAGSSHCNRVFQVTKTI